MRIDNATTQLNLNSAQEKSALNGGDDFGKVLTDALSEVNEAQFASREMQNKLMANQPVDVEDLMISMEKASTAMQLTLQVRNKLLEAYQEISRMQV